MSSPFDRLNDTIVINIIFQLVMQSPFPQLSKLRWLYEPPQHPRRDILYVRRVSKLMRYAMDNNTNFIETHLVMGKTAIPHKINLKWFAGKVYLKLTTEATPASVIKSYLDALSDAKVTVDCSSLRGQVNDKDVHTWLAGYSNVVAVDLTFCYNITNATMASLATCPRLESVSVASCHKITDAGMAFLATCPRLEKVTLALCDNISDAGVALLATCPKLQTMDLFCCDGITDAAAASLERHPTFQSGTFGGEGGQLTDKAVASLATCPKLSTLDISGNEYLTDKAVAHLATCPNLVTLNLSKCRNITDASITLLAQHKKLRKVILYDCEMITVSADQLVASSMTFRGLP